MTHIPFATRRGRVSYSRLPNAMRPLHNVASLRIFYKLGLNVSQDFGWQVSHLFGKDLDSTNSNQTVSSVFAMFYDYTTK
jgi:hypothetical protein